jgi:hypothetical protein
LEAAHELPEVVALQGVLAAPVAAAPVAALPVAAAPVAALPVAAPPGVVTVAEGVLELVAIPPGLDGGDDLRQLIAVEPPDPPQRLVDLGALDLELALVGENLPGHAGVVRHRGEPLGARIEHLEGACVGIAALALVHDRPHAVARDGARDEHDVPAVSQPRDALAAIRERVDLELELIPAVGPHRQGWPTSSSRRAFWAWRRFSA